MSIFREIQKQVCFALLLVVAILMFNNATNRHKHLLANGQTIVHAHPFSKQQDSNPLKKHTHTDSELLYISLINNLLSLVLLVVFSFILIKTILKEFLFLYSNRIYFSLIKSSVRLRAPPLSFL